MADENPLHINQATIAGYWIGLAGLIVSLFGLGLSAYLAYKTPDSVFLVASGWIAALLLGVVAERVGRSLVRTILLLQQQFDEKTKAYIDEIQTSNQRISELELELEKQCDRVAEVIRISDFVAAKAVRAAPKPRAKPEQAKEAE